jgi:hypothetical protein
MPSNNGFRLDNRDGVQHRRKQAIEPDKDQSVGDRQSRIRRNAPVQHVQLMSQQDDLGFQPRLRPERRTTWRSRLRNAIIEDQPT